MGHLMPFRSVALESLQKLLGLSFESTSLQFLKSFRQISNFKSIKKEIISFSNPFDTFLSETNLFQN